MRFFSNLIIFCIFFELGAASHETAKGLPLYYWQQQKFVNFGDYLSLKIVERMVDGPVRVCKSSKLKEKKLLALGSILTFALNDDVIWGTGVNGKWLDLKNYNFTRLDVRAVRGPHTRDFIQNNFGISCPEIYGDPALLMPILFPEFRKAENPDYDYIVIPGYQELVLFPKSSDPCIVHPTDPWDEVVLKILNSRFVISSSLHGIVVAEAYGIPARLLKVTMKEPLFKYEDYYLGTNRPDFRYATSVEEALEMGGEKPFVCDLKKLYNSFPFEYWPSANIKNIEFTMWSTL